MALGAGGPAYTSRLLLVPKPASLRHPSSGGLRRVDHACMTTLQRLDDVLDEIAGTVMLPRTLVDRALGRSGSRTFDRMRAVRSVFGWVDASYPQLAELAGEPKVSWQAIRRGAARLQAAGLLCRVKDGSRRRLRLYGAAAQTDEGLMVVVTPRPAADQIRQTPGWGGTRAGAGRKAPSSAKSRTSKSSVAKAPFKRGKSPDRAAPIGLETQRFHVLSSVFKCGHLLGIKCGHLPLAHDAGTYNNYVHTEGMYFPLVSYGDQERTLSRFADSWFSFSLSQDTGDISMGVDPPDSMGGEPVPLTPDELQLEKDMDSLAGLLSKPGARRGRSSNHLGRPGVPPYPGSDVVRLAKVPAPPLLDAERDAEGRAKQLARIYHQAIDARYLRTSKAACGTFWGVLNSISRSKSSRPQREKLHRSRYFKMLVAAAEALIEHGIPPAAWISFALDIWQKYDDASRDITQPPMPMYILSPKQIGRWRGWFWSEGGAHLGGKLLFTDTYKELLARYTDLQRDLRALPEAVDQVKIYDTVEQHFPGDDYDVLVETSNAEAKHLQERIREMRRRGEWLWTDSAWGM